MSNKLALGKLIIKNHKDFMYSLEELLKIINSI